jgi:hypothetical protein
MWIVVTGPAGIEDIELSFDGEREAEIKLGRGDLP